MPTSTHEGLQQWGFRSEVLVVLVADERRRAYPKASGHERYLGLSVGTFLGGT